MFWTLTVLSLIGVILNIYKKQICFYIWAVTNAAWSIIDFCYGMPEQGTLFAVYFVLAIWGIIQWRKEAKAKLKEGK